jgi:hypothetical protein
MASLLCAIPIFVPRDIESRDEVIALEPVLARPLPEYADPGRTPRRTTSAVTRGQCDAKDEEADVKQTAGL